MFVSAGGSGGIIHAGQGSDRAKEGISRADAGGSVRIIRDQYGVPHIFADSLADACFGQGYCHAEDNLQQILRNYVVARGRGTTVFGSKYTDKDFWLRACRIPEISQRLYESMSPGACRIVDSYADGINRYLEEHPSDKPNWATNVTGQDVVALAKAYQFRDACGIVQLDFRRAGQTHRELDQAGRRIAQSNMWAIGPSKSTNGGIMLASDPHLPWHGETQWYEVHLIVGDRWMYGVGFFGWPGVAGGFTRDIAWAGTNNGADIADVYRETINPNNPDEYFYDGHWHRISETTIRLADGPANENVRVLRSTHHGPIFFEDRSRHVAYSARLAGLETSNLPELVPHLFNARKITDLENVYDAGHFFKWNRIVIDRHGHMAYYFHAATHQRNDRFDWNAPVDGSVQETEWGKPISWRDMPHLSNPSCGFLVNCNNSPYTVIPTPEIDPTRFPRHLTSATVLLAPTTRAYRAMKLIQAKQQLDFDDLERLATDVKAMTARPYVQQIVDAHRRARAQVADPEGDLDRAVEILRDWDGMATIDNKALPILETCIVLGGKEWTPSQLRKRSPRDILQDLLKALEAMRHRWGTIEIAWGKIHVTQRGDLKLPIPGAGNTMAADPFTTLWMAGASRVRDGKLVTDQGSSWIQLVEYAGGIVHAKTILPYGNSNNVDSPHYSDQVRLFASRKLKTALLTQEEIEANATQDVTLVR